MRNLKRALSLALASVMLLGMMVVGSGAVGYTDVTSEDHKEAIEVVQAAGLMTGDDQGNFNPDQIVTRAEMAVIVCNLLYGKNLDVGQFTGIHNFSDVPAWAEGYVNLAASLGIVAGVGDGKFAPNDPITTAQAALMLSRALGYFKTDAEMAQGWMLAATERGTKIGLYNGMSGLSATAGLTRNNVAQMAFNALTYATPVEYYDALGMYSSVGNGIGGVVNGDNRYDLTLASKNYDIAHTDKNGTAITYGAADGVDGNAYKIVSNTYDIAVNANQIGRMGYVWYTVNDKDEAIAASNVVYTDKVLATVSNGKTMTAWTTRSNDNFVAELDSAYNSGDDKYIVNGAAADSYGDAGINALESQKGVVFTFVDTNNNGKANLVYVSDRTVTTLTGDAATKEEGGKTIVNVPGISGLAFSNSVETKDVIGYEGLKEDDVVLWYRDGQTNDYIIEKAQTVTGDLTAIKDNKYTINGTAYEASGMATTPFSSITTANLNKQVQVWLDASGYVVKAEAVEEAALPYALVVNYDNMTMAGQMTKLLTADGQYITGYSQYYAGSDKKTMGDGSNGTVNIAKGAVIVHYELKDGVYELTAVGASNATTEGTIAVSSITNGNPSLGGSVVGNADTKFVLVDAQDNVTTYTGMTNVPTTTGTETAIGKNGVASLVFVTNAVSTTTAASDIIYIFDMTPSISKDGDTTLYTYDVLKEGVITTETFSSDVRDGKVSDTKEIDGLGAYKVTSRDSKGYATAVADAAAPYNFTANLGSGDPAKSLSANTLTYGANSSILVDDKTVVIKVDDTTGEMTVGALSDIQATTTAGFDYSEIEVIAVVKDGAATNTASIIFIMDTETFSIPAPATVTLAGADSNGATVTGTTDVKAGTAAVTSWTSTNKYIKVTATAESGCTISSVKINGTDATSSFELTTTTAHTLNVVVTVSHTATGLTQDYNYTISVPAQT